MPTCTRATSRSAPQPATFGRYIALDFGIVGTLTDSDRDYLAQNFIAFFRRDYKRVAELHVESGWVPPATRIDALESAIRAVCEPHFDRPLKDISLGQVLMRLFQTSRRFNVEIQPQLVLLQKTLLNIEGLGRQLDPDLDLWSTAKPFLERWMNEQVGWQGLLERLKDEAPRYAKLLPELPRLMHAALQPRSESTVMQAHARRAAPHASAAAGHAVGGHRIRRRAAGCATPVALQRLVALKSMSVCAGFSASSARLEAREGARHQPARGLVGDAGQRSSTRARWHRGRRPCRWPTRA